jgi:peptide/nickel transport system substrate-binding protein/oligopeptide transport system substrate-binding protein
MRKQLVTGIMPALLLLFSLLLAACGGSSAPGSSSTGNQGQPAPADKQVFRWPTGNADFTTLDPGLAQYANSIIVINTLFTGLVELNTTGEMIHVLAASHQISSDGLTYTFPLRDGLKFSDGSPLTADDIVYSINRTLDPATKSEVSYYFSAIKDYDKFQSGKVKTLIGTSLLAPDPKTVKIILGQPTGYFLAALTFSSSYVVNRKLIEKYGDKWTDHMAEGGSSGPFQVQTYSHSRGITEVPNPNYFGDKPKLQKLEFLIGGDQDVEYKSYLSGQFEYAHIPPINYQEARARKDFQSALQLRTWFITFNYLTPPFDNINIRKAFALAINKELLNKSVLRNAAHAVNRFVPSGAIEGYNNENIKGPDGTTNLTGNPDLAKQLLAQGLKEKGYKSVADLPPITYTDRNQKQTNDIATFIIQQWKDVLGVNVKLNVLEIGKFNEELSNSRNNPKGLQVWYAGWGQDYPDPQDWLSVFLGKGVDQNTYNYGENNSPVAAEQQAVQKQLLQADVLVDQKKRYDLYLDAEQKAISDVTWVPLYQPNLDRLISTKVGGFHVAHYEAPSPVEWARVYIIQ